MKRWKRAWRGGGVAALAAKPHPGPAPKLSRQQKQELMSILLRGAVASGFRNELWTCARVAEIVRTKFGVLYHPDYVGRILHDLGFSPQKPQRVAREQDRSAVKRCRRQDWPRIEKKRSDAAPASYLSTKQDFVCNR
ncbi:MAG: winged helix-turn-helix domain-containing protein [Planctomycetales bacterium]|nr:winged helix-turn-helix domain-containing protein [Planctomycetales bacterium]